MKIVKQKQGQFIIIAALMIAIMIISIGAIMYGAVTYFRYERWEEYLAIIDNLKLGSNRVVELSLAYYTTNVTMNETLKNNLDQWRSNITRAYAGFGIVLSYLLANDTQQAYNESIDYNLGLACQWYSNVSFSAANATIAINLTSVGLTGYNFTAPVFLRVKIFDATYDGEELGIYLVADKEGPTPITNLKKSDFLIVLGSFNLTDFTPDFTLIHYYDAEKYNSFVYKISCQNVDDPSFVLVMVTDSRNINVIANSTVTLG